MDPHSDGVATQDASRGSDRDYASSDALLRDVEGGNGTDAQAIATGYMMAIRDADADCLSASTLLSYLCGADGRAFELTGMGYVMAVRDCMRALPNDTARSPATLDRARMRTDAALVKDWLERRGQGVIQPAIASVQIAVGERDGARPHGAGAGGSTWSIARWAVDPSRRAPAKLALAAVLAIAAVVVVLGPPRPAGRIAPDRQDLIVSMQAANIMTTVLEQRRYEKDSIINLANPAESAAYVRKWDETRIAFITSLDTLDTLNLSAEDRRSLGEMRHDFGLYELGYQQLVAQMRSGSVRTPMDANRLLETYKPAAHRIESNGVGIAARALRRLQMG